MTIEETLNRLSKSKFRSSFYLSKKDKEYFISKGEDKIKEHAADFVKNRISAAEPINDGKQTPMSGHPIFKAMHACACCCRGCLNKWHNIEIGKELTSEQQEEIVNLLMAWTKKEMDK